MRNDDTRFLPQIGIVVNLPQSVDAFGDESFNLTVMQELLSQAKAFEPELMRVAGGWLGSPVDVHGIVSALSPEKGAIDVALRLRFQSQVVPGCGTSAVASDHDIPATLQIDRATGAGKLVILAE